MKSTYNTEIYIEKNAESFIKELFNGEVQIIVTPSSLKSVENLIGDSRKIYLTKDYKLELIKPDTKSIIGVGGGTAIDIAKYFASISKKRLIVIPTVLSTNAFATSKTCTRKITQKTLDSKMPDQVIIDLEIIKRANPRYNIAGAGDILSIYTANYDWKLHNKENFNNFNKDVYDYTTSGVALSLLDTIKKCSQQIKENSLDGLKTLAELLIFSGYVTSMYGNGRPESGSEHLFVNVVESEIKKDFLHGELVSLGTIIMSYLQDNDPSYITKIIDSLGLSRSLTQIGITREETIESLYKAKSVRKDRYTILQKLDLSKKDLENTLEKLLQEGLIKI